MGYATWLPIAQFSPYSILLQAHRLTELSLFDLKLLVIKYRGTDPTVDAVISYRWSTGPSLF